MLKCGRRRGAHCHGTLTISLTNFTAQIALPVTPTGLNSACFVSASIEPSVASDRTDTVCAGVVGVRKIAQAPAGVGSSMGRGCLRRTA
jgi:hypothetical protein